MKKYLFLILISVLPVSCLQDMNDLVHEEVVAEITAFEIENQKSSLINIVERTIKVEMPVDTDLSKLKVKSFKYTEGARLDKDIKEGDIIDLSDTCKLELFTYDPYIWTITAHSPLSPGAPVTLNGPDPGVELTNDGPQVYNMGFDIWGKYPGNDLIDVLYDTNATEDQKTVWNNYGLAASASGFPVIEPEYDALAVTGAGKAALKLTSIDVSGMFVAGGVFTGEDHFWPWFKSLKWGVSFPARPLALEGYVLYRPKTIDKFADPYLDREGKQDMGHIIVLLTDEPVSINPPDTYISFTEDSDIIGYAKMVFDGEMTEYEKFQLNIIYRDNRTPQYATIVVSASALGDYMTGAVGSVLYVDELAFLYEKKN